MRRTVAYPPRSSGLVAASLLALAVLLLARPGPCHGGAGGEEYRLELRERARRLGLADERYWDVLLHYRRGLTGRHSLVDDRRFFLSPRGKTDPAAELEAAVDGLFTAAEREEESPRCRFPARYAWLDEKLAVDRSRLPGVSCPELDGAIRRIDPRSATFIFATGHMNAPASMFGHTLLRIDSEYESPLLSHAVNYAATVDPRDGGFAYAFKGIFGLYPGYYSILPYYEKVKEYRGMDQRDLWEYPLVLSREQVRRMTLHVLELRGIYSDYFFFGENCSYNLLFLLEAASPESRLTDRFSGWTVPADTLKEAIAAGLLASPEFRPSQARKIRQIAASLDGPGADLAAAVADGTVPAAAVEARALPPGERARILDAAAEAIQLRYMKKALPKEEFLTRYMEILGERSRIAAGAAGLPPVPRPPPPEAGHGSARVSLATGAREDDFFVEIGLRPAYHGLLDDDAGYTAGSQIEFLAGALRWYPEGDRFRVHRLDLVNIVSLSGRDRFFRPVSWKVDAAVADRPFPGTGTTGRYALVLNPGGGFAWTTGPLGLVYGLFETEGAVSAGYDGDYAVSVGLSGGLIRPMTRSWKVVLDLRRTFGVLGDTRQGSRFTASFRNGIRLGQDLALFLEASREDAEGVHLAEGRAALNYYF